jgi:Mn-dependent DtxR family transcriptional regulator
VLKRHGVFLEISPEELEAESRSLEAAVPSERAATIWAVQEALADMQAGDTGRPVRGFLAEIRSKDKRSVAR